MYVHIQQSTQYIWIFVILVLIGLRMKRSRKRQPIRSWPCKKLWRWRKSARCQPPTFPSLRKFLFVSYPLTQFWPVRHTLEINLIYFSDLLLSVSCWFVSDLYFSSLIPILRVLLLCVSQIIDLQAIKEVSFDNKNCFSCFFSTYLYFFYSFASWYWNIEQSSVVISKDICPCLINRVFKTLFWTLTLPDLLFKQYLMSFLSFSFNFFPFEQQDLYKCIQGIKCTENFHKELEYIFSL